MFVDETTLRCHKYLIYCTYMYSIYSMGNFSDVENWIDIFNILNHTGSNL